MAADLQEIGKIQDGNGRGRAMGNADPPNNMRILIVEDDPRLFGPMADDLRRQRHTVDVATDGKTGFEYAASGVHDLILLDIMLPGENGLSVCRRLRAADDRSMILMITALDAIEDKVAALDAGADDYIVKPFDLAELSARIRAVARRSREIRSTVLQHGELVLDPRAAIVTVRDRPIDLTRSEYVILETLMRHRQQLFTRQMLHEKVTAIDHDAAPESIRTHVGNLRRKLQVAGCGNNLIKTVYGSGYRFSEK
jgi:two-component system response regulator QseB